MSSARTCAWPSAAQYPEQHHEREGNNCPEVSRGHKIRGRQERDNAQ